MATQRIVILVTADGTETVIRNISGIGSAAKSSASSVDFLKSALGTVASGQVLKSAGDLLDTYQNMQNRLRVVTRSEDELRFATQQLMDVANRSRGSFESTVEMYSRMALSSDQLGFSHQQLIKVTETLNKAVLVSGASSREANAALIQLSQGLAGGALKGDEMRAVLNQIPYVADLIAQKMGVTRGALRVLGSQGKVTADIIISALLGASDKVDKAFGKTFPTIESGFEQLKNKVLDVAGAVNEKYQIIPKVTAALQFLGANIEILGRVAFGAVLVGGVLKAIEVINRLTLALATNPIGFIAVVIVAAVTAIALFSDKIKFATDGVATLGDFAKAIWEEMGKDISYLSELFSTEFGFIGDLLKQVFGSDFSLSIKGFLLVAASGLDGFVGIVSGSQKAAAAALNTIVDNMKVYWTNVLNDILQMAEKTINNIILKYNEIANSTIGQKLNFSTISLKNLGRVDAPQLSAAGKSAGEAFMEGVTNATTATDFVNRMTARAEQIGQERIKRDASAAAKLQADLARGQADSNKIGQPDESLRSQRDEAIGRVTQRLTEEGEALKENSLGRAVAIDLIKIENQLRRSGIELTDGERAALSQQLEQNEMLKERARLLNSIDGEQERNARSQAVLNDLIKQGTGNTAQYQSALRQLQIAQLMANRDAASGFKAGFLQVQEEITDFASASSKVVTDAFHGMEDALVDFVKTGKLNFSGLVDSILADLTRLLVRQAIMGLLNSLGGGGGIFGAIAGGLSGARADGGPVTAGKSYLVGERGPEIFTPPTSGNITPNGGGQGGPSSTNVTVINVTSEDDIAAYLSSPAAGEKIINHIRRNPTAMKQAMGGVR